MSGIMKKIKNNQFLILVSFAYFLLFIIMPEKGIQSVKNSLYYIKEMIIIMPVILLLTTLIEAWVPKKTIQSALGEGAGIKGLLFSFLLGSVSAGPIYAAFPVCKMLLKKGATIANIIVILSAWAVIKVPMLVNESKFLGQEFMILRWILTIIAILIMSTIMEKLVKKEEIPMNEVILHENMVLSIDNDLCIGCGVCSRMLPEDIVMEEKRGKVLNEILYSQLNEKYKAVMEQCPSKAIKFIEKI